MIRKRLFGALLFGFLATSTLLADVVVRVGPPRNVVERRGRAPGRDYVWISGYHNWDGHRHVWVPGRWDRAPRMRAKWVPHRWVRRNHGWVFVEGHWR
ncbi:MAG TPA: YXWGXW repeat-containing protein [Bryobacteraceae bacterium]|nr:YXWGXW repeat-containing protein [Bryobacteraceae bacterium]